MHEWDKAAEFRLRAAELTLGRPAPDFTLKDINGEIVSLKDFRGKVVLLDFWATWCGPCIHELPNLKAIYDKHKDNPDFVLIGISWDDNDDTVARFVENNEMPWIHIRATEEMQTIYNVTSIPHYTVIDKNGLIREENLRDGIELDSIISSLIAESPGEPDKTQIAKLHKLRAELHVIRSEHDKAISEYEQALQLQPNDIQLIMKLIELYKVDHREKAIALYEKALPRFIEANQSKTDAGSMLNFMLGHTALEVAWIYSEHGNAEKCWQAFQIAMDNDPDGHLAKRAKRMSEQFSVISDRPAFKAFTEAARETEADRRHDEYNRKRSEFGRERYEAWKSYLAVAADGAIFTGVVLSSTGHLLVPDIVADATDIAANTFKNWAPVAEYLPAKITARDSEARLAVLKLEGTKYLRPVEMGTVDALKEYAPYDYAMTDGRAGRAFPTIALVSARNHPAKRRVGEMHEYYRSVSGLEIGTSGNFCSVQIDTEPLSPRSPLSDVFVHYDGSLLGVCVDDEGVYKGALHNYSSPRYNILPIDKVQASLAQMGMAHLVGNQGPPVQDRPFYYFVEAEHFAKLAGDKRSDVFVKRSDEAASGGEYLVAPHGDKQSTWLVYKVDIPEDGDYAIWMRTLSHDGKSDSFFVATDVEPNLIACDTTSHGRWGWVPAIDRESIRTTSAFQLTKGKHEIRIYVREPRTQLDAIYLTNNLRLAANGVAERFNGSE